ncbi:MAG: DUF1338 family protein [Oleiphilaceae bacterium]|nr:DUF1338 family protein [Oleiphilaceae bacterium]
MSGSDTLLHQLLRNLRGEHVSNWLMQSLVVHASTHGTGERADRLVLSQALNMLLFWDLCERVPDAKTYTDEKTTAGQRVFLDHGALRTVQIAMDKLPSGKHAFSRILVPLGYREVGEYPLEKLRMCGFVYQHQDLPADLSQFFISELYPERFSSAFQQAVSNVVCHSTDPLSTTSAHLLQQLEQQGWLGIDDACTVLENLITCFGRQHPPPSIEDYQTLKQESAEMAWIATEGNAFNHATDRVEDVDRVAETERSKGRPMKPFIEEGRHAHIRQTAYRATPVHRPFASNEGEVRLEVPGSFFEFIERGAIIDEHGIEAGLDLRFDSANAQGIFKMTSTP